MAVDTTTAQRTEVARLAAELDDMWAFIDRLLDAVPVGRWTEQYGKDWTFQDVPWHLAYFDRIMIAEPLEAGRTLPASQQFNLGTTRELNAWNEAEFANRPSGCTPQRSIADLRAVHARIRGWLATADDSRLDEPVFDHFFGNGWHGTVRAALRSAQMHSWGEGTELMVRLGRKDAVPAAATRNAIEGYTGFMKYIADPAAAAKAPFTVVFDFTGPGGSPYTLRVTSEGAHVSNARSADADVVLTLDPVTFNCVMLRRMQNPMVAMLRRKIKVKGLRSMGRMQKVFRQPGLDERLSASLFG